ncbi:hypothetical protein FQN57_003097 [Myotisia sp. PD_48]|nr:hypothetical protein FQN57_003097 [Myotisia sp. PD_48]
MKRDFLPIETLAAWAKLNSVTLCGVAIKRLQAGSGAEKGTGLVGTSLSEERGLPPLAGSDGITPQTIIKVPAELVLSLETVENYAKSDRYLSDVLEAAGPIAKTTRGAVMIFLLIQMAHTSLALRGEHVGNANPWTEYIKFFPPIYRMPTFYSGEERELLQGTSLEPALNAKFDSLKREYADFRERTEKIPWCKRDWYDEETREMRVDEWALADAIYRSRALDLPGTGHAMVPCIDMVNHAAGDKTIARYDTDPEGNAVLQVCYGRQLRADEEITITYGDDKGAAEMMFSYGFIEDNVTYTHQVLLDLEIPDDDPLKPPKLAICDKAHGVRLFIQEEDDPVEWSSEFIWWMCVNEEDGLRFQVSQTTDGERKLKAFWKRREIEKYEDLEGILAEDPMWDVFRLRAVVMLQNRVHNQLELLLSSKEYVRGLVDTVDDNRIRRHIWDVCTKLRRLEEAFFIRTVADLEVKKTELIALDTVSKYLKKQQSRNDADEDNEDDEVDEDDEDDEDDDYS